MIALDLFAGTGWGVACQRLGIEELGVEIMPEARAVREANGMRTIFSDVWHGLEPGSKESELVSGAYDILIASPPCQTFSIAGSGAGRQALDTVLELVDRRAFLDLAELRAFEGERDPRTALVLAPLAYIARDVPEVVVLEQVPPALPVWEKYAEVMRDWGYSVWVGIVHAEQYGVPQTRKRAILIARADGGEAKPPTPTRSRYYPRDPKRLDAGVDRWVSMAEALGWDIEPGEVVARSSFGNPKRVNDDGSTAGGHHTFDPAAAPGHTVTGLSGGWRVMRSNYGSGGDPANRGERNEDQPAPAVTSKVDRNKWLHGETGEAIKLDPAKPATTVQGDPRLTAREHYNHGEQSATSTRVTVAEASTLQSYPVEFNWSVEVHDAKSGKTRPISKAKQFLQIGNAVPPLLAEAVLRAAIA